MVWETTINTCTTRTTSWAHFLAGSAWEHPPLTTFLILSTHLTFLACSIWTTSWAYLCGRHCDPFTLECKPILILTCTNLSIWSLFPLSRSRILSPMPRNSVIGHCFSGMRLKVFLVCMILPTAGPGIRMTRSFCRCVVWARQLLIGKRFPCIHIHPLRDFTQLFSCLLILLVDVRYIKNLEFPTQLPPPSSPWP